MNSDIRRLALSDIDSVFLGLQPVPIQMAFFFPGTLSLEPLEDALNSIFPSFWPLLGTIGISSDGKPEVYLGKSHPRVKIAVKEFPQFQWSSKMDLNALSQMGLKRLSTSETPLFSAQLTRIQGGQILGVSMSHALVDGYSFFFFLEQWSRQSRGLSPAIPNHQRERHTGIKAKSLFLDEITKKEFTDATGFFFQSDSSENKKKNPFLDPSSTFDWETLEISQQELQEITEALSPDDGIRRSLNDVLCEFLYRKYGPEQGTLTVPVDVRRLSPRLKETRGAYFGNGIRPVTLQVRQPDPPGSIAHQVGVEVRKLRIEKVDATLNFLASLESRDGASPFQKFKVMDPDHGLLITNLSRLPLETLIFGNLAPSDLRILTPMVGAAVILPRATGAFVQISKPLLTQV
ncbi:MAG: hypothetical protein K2X47_04550 [Bdellovibrionales bacterium]|nr:hypothetical protein [Bdellovibrionales bacterium]